MTTYNIHHPLPEPPTTMKVLFWLSPHLVYKHFEKIIATVSKTRIMQTNDAKIIAALYWEGLVQLLFTAK